MADFDLQEEVERLLRKLDLTSIKAVASHLWIDDIEDVEEPRAIRRMIQDRFDETDDTDERNNMLRGLPIPDPHFPVYERLLAEHGVPDVVSDNDLVENTDDGAGGRGPVNGLGCYLDTNHPRGGFDQSSREETGGNGTRPRDNDSLMMGLNNGGRQQSFGNNMLEHRLRQNAFQQQNFGEFMPQNMGGMGQNGLPQRNSNGLQDGGLLDFAGYPDPDVRRRPRPGNQWNDDGVQQLYGAQNVGLMRNNNYYNGASNNNNQHNQNNIDNQNSNQHNNNNNHYNNGANSNNRSGCWRCWW